MCDKPCPKCGASSDGWRERHPDADGLSGLLEIVHDHKVVQLSNERAISVCFLASALEVVLDVFLQSATEMQKVNDRIDASADFESRLRGCDRYLTASLADVLNSASLYTFLEGWCVLVSAQRRLMRGDWSAGYTFDIGTLEYLRDNVFHAYAAMHEDARSKSLEVAAKPKPEEETEAQQDAP
jgi:hypothetical protein